MDLRKLSGHTVDVDRLPEAPMVLDVGCRGFDFTADILRLRPKAQIMALDPDPEILKPKHLPVTFVNMALVHDERKFSRYASYSTGEGNMLTDLEKYYDAKMLTVHCIDIQTLMSWMGTKCWDLVKLDCEGSEFDILANWPGPIADQISVEFHDGHPEEYGEHRVEWGEKLDEICKRLCVGCHPIGYKVIQHELSKQGDWYGHWDTLLTL